MAQPYGGTQTRGFTSSQLRLGRSESVKEFLGTLQKQTTDRLRQTTSGIGRQAVSAAVAPLPGPMQASLYSLLTPSSYSSRSGSTGSTAERIPGVSSIAKPKELWQKNLEKLFKVPLPVVLKKDKLQALENKREGDAKPAVKVDKDKDKKDKEETKGFFGRLFDGFKNLFNFKGGLGNFLSKLLGGAGALAIGALKFAKGVGILGLLGTVIFSDRIIELLTNSFEEEAKDWDVSKLRARILYFLAGDQEGSFAASLSNMAKWGFVGGISGWMLLGPHGLLAGAIIGGALGAITGALGAKKLAQISNFVEKWWNEGWSKARIQWEEKELENLNKEKASLEELAEDAKKRGDDVTTIQLRNKLILINKQIQDQERDLYYLKLHDMRKERDSLTERLDKLKEQNKRLGETFSNITDIVTEDDVRQAFNKLNDPLVEKVESQDSLDGKNWETKITEIDRQGIGMSYDEFLKLDFREQQDAIEKFRSQRLFDLMDQSQGDLLEFLNAQDILRQQKIRPRLSGTAVTQMFHFLTDPNNDLVVAKLHAAMEKAFGEEYEMITPDLIGRKLESDPEKMKKIFNETLSKEIKEQSILLEDLNRNVQRFEGESPVSQKEPDVVPASPAETIASVERIIPALELIGEDAKKQGNINVHSPTSVDNSIKSNKPVNVHLQTAKNLTDSNGWYDPVFWSGG